MLWKADAPRGRPKSGIDPSGAARKLAGFGRLLKPQTRSVDRYARRGRGFNLFRGRQREIAKRRRAARTSDVRFAKITVAKNQIIVMLREQNELLREQRRTSH